MTFLQWLEKQEYRDDPVGDFAKDARRAVLRSGTAYLGDAGLQGWADHLRMHQAAPESFKALRQAWREYNHETNT